MENKKCTVSRADLVSSLRKNAQECHENLEIIRRLVVSNHTKKLVMTSTGYRRV